MEGHGMRMKEGFTPAVEKHLPACGRKVPPGAGMTFGTGM